MRLSQDFRGTEHAYLRFLNSRGRIAEEAPSSDPVALLLRRYRRYLCEVRDFAASTVQQHEATISEFLGRALRAGDDVATLTGLHVERYLAQKSKQITRQSMQHVVGHLRAFLRYGWAAGLIREQLDAIDTPRTYRDELPPRALPWVL